MKALLLVPFEGRALEALRRCVEVVYEPWTETRRIWDPSELGDRLGREGVAILVVEADFLFEEMFVEAHALRFAGICRNALNQVDLEAATRHGVLVVNTPGRNAQAVAEHTFGLLLALARRIPQAHHYVQSGAWRDPVEPYLSMRGVELAGKTLGVVGLGQIGRKVARLARAFSMRVLATDPYAKPLPGVSMVELDALLRESDFVTLHAPEPTDGRRLLDAERLALLKPHAYVLNTAAPGLVDSEALAEMLRAGRLAGAALDVFDSAPLPVGSTLLSLPNVVLTPHVGGATDGTVARYSQAMVEDLLRFLDGKRPRHLVNPQAWRRRRG